MNRSRSASVVAGNRRHTQLTRCTANLGPNMCGSTPCPEPVPRKRRFRLSLVQIDLVAHLDRWTSCTSKSHGIQTEPQSQNAPVLVSRWWVIPSAEQVQTCYIEEMALKPFPEQI